MFKIDVDVKWVSYPSGVETTKTGKIVDVVPKYNLPSRMYKDIFKSGKRPARNVESYVVLEDKTGKYYWPAVNALQVVTKKTTTKKATTSKDTAKSLLNVAKGLVNETPKKKLLNVVGFVTDNSGSMDIVKNKAKEDFNSVLAQLKETSIETGQKTLIFTRDCTDIYSVGFIHENVDVENVPLLTSWKANGGTPLYDSIGTLIERIQEFSVSYKDYDVSYLIIVTTDGDENTSRRFGMSDIKNKFKTLTGTDRWSFVFRGPNGSKHKTQNLGVPTENIIEWDYSDASMNHSTTATNSSLRSFYSARSSGATNSTSFYANTSHIKPSDIKNTFKDISSSVLTFKVDKDAPIRDFVESKGLNFSTGAGFYELTKTETVQPYKGIIVEDAKNKVIYGQADARNLLNLPSTGDIKLKPGNIGNYKVYVQSTSVNRKLLAGTQMIYLK